MGAGAGAFGPYRRRRTDGSVGWLVIVRAEPGGPTENRTFEEEGAALAWRDDNAKAISATRDRSRTVEEAIDLYEKHLEAENHRQRTETIRRVRSFFEGEEDTALVDLTTRDCARLYEAVTKRKVTRWQGSGSKRKLVALDRTLSATTHRGMLTHAKTFLSWCAGKRWIRANPLDGVKGKGRIRRGKQQLRVDEARKWEATAWQIASTKSGAGAVAALCALYLGLRASEIISRQVRDLDDEGQLLWIEDTPDFQVKTDTSRRHVKTGALLRPYLQALAKKQKKPTDLLFGADPRGRKHQRGWVLFWVKKIAKVAGVPAVGTHSMRGLAETLARQEGGQADLIAAAFGHSRPVADAHYVQPGVARDVKRRDGLKVLAGGKSGKKAG